MNNDHFEQCKVYEALNAYVDRLLAEQHAALPAGLSRSELVLYVLAAEMKGMQPGADMPSEAFLTHLKTAVDHEVQRRRTLAMPRVPRRMSRGSFLRGAGTLAAGVLVGVAIDHQIGSSHPSLPSLVGANGRWYLLASTIDVPIGNVHRFIAGGIDGYLFNENGHYRAVSAICTHMGCHLDWKQEMRRFHCLCHEAQYEASGAVAMGVPTIPLPTIAVREEAGQIYAWGTQQHTWG